MANSYAKAGRFNDACPLFQRALTLGEDQLIYGVLLQNYGDVLRKLGQKHEGQLLRSKGILTQKAFLRRNGIGSTIDISALRLGQ